MEPVFVKEWLGTFTGVRVQKVDPLNKGETYSEVYRPKRATVEPCTGLKNCKEIPANEAVNQTSFYGKYICGVRGGDPFSTVVRPDSKFDRCPIGTQRCSKSTSLEHTVCYPPDEMDTKCPITDLKIVQNKDLRSYPKSSYKRRTFNSTSTLVYSKTKGDNLPIGTTKVEHRPCAKPNQVSFDIYNEKKYILENVPDAK